MNKKVIAAAIGLVAVVAVGVYAAGGQGGLQGFMKKPQAMEFTVVLSDPSNSGSPSPTGARALSVSDDVANYRVCVANNANHLNLKTAVFSINAPSGFREVTLNGIKIGERLYPGNSKVHEQRDSSYKAAFTLSEDIEFRRGGECKELRFNFDTAASLNDRAGADDNFRFTLNGLYDKNGITLMKAPTTANDLRY